MSWRLSADPIFKYLAEKNPYYSVYMFGVYTGESVCDIINSFRKHKKECAYYCLDSFVGLPNESKEDRTQEGWIEGEFSSSKAFGTSSIEETIKVLEDRIRRETPISNEVLDFIPGFYSESLTKSLIEEKSLSPALYVDIDCDLYSSTVDVLDWMFSNELIIPGTVIAYDDWGGTPGWFVNYDGESKAHMEMCEKYKVSCRKIFQSGNMYPHVQRMFLVQSVG